MVDNIYKNSFKEVYEILENTDQELIKKIPLKFIDFIKNNMNNDYQTNIEKDVPIDKQKLLKETESILALIYRSYWATDEEKLEFAKIDKNQYFENEEKKKEEYNGKNIDEVFEKRKNLKNITLNNDLMVIPKENFIKRLFNKFKNIFRK